MRLTPVTLTLSDDNWMFILDSLNDRLENLTDLDGMGLEGFSQDIAHCESIMRAITERIAD